MPEVSGAKDAPPPPPPPPPPETRKGDGPDVSPELRSTYGNGGPARGPAESASATEVRREGEPVRAEQQARNGAAPETGKEPEVPRELGTALRDQRDPARSEQPQQQSTDAAVNSTSPSQPEGRDTSESPGTAADADRPKETKRPEITDAAMNHILNGEFDKKPTGWHHCPDGKPPDGRAFAPNSQPEVGPVMKVAAEETKASDSSDRPEDSAEQAAEQGTKESDGSGQPEDSAEQAGSDSPEPLAGTSYRAENLVFTKEDGGMKTKAMSTFFPNEWSADQVRTSVNEAWHDPDGERDDGHWTGMDSNGNALEGWYDRDTKELRTAYPRW